MCLGSFYISDGLVSSDGISHGYTFTDLQVPDLGQNRKLMPLSCHIRPHCANNGYSSCHTDNAGGGTWVAQLHLTRPWDS